MTKGDRKYGSNTGSRAADGKLRTGNPGKPKGAGHRATLADRLGPDKAVAL